MAGINSNIVQSTTATIAVPIDHHVILAGLTLTAYDDGVASVQMDFEDRKFKELLLCQPLGQIRPPLAVKESFLQYSSGR